MARHKKFSSIGRDLTQEIEDGKTYRTNRKINKIVIHCTFSPLGRGDGAKEIDQWHLQRWGSKSGCGYHYVVLEDGTIQKGRWVDYAGAHARGQNANSIAIVRTGGMNSKGGATYDATREQIKAIKKLTLLLKTMYKLDTKQIYGHTELPGVNKSCPLLTRSQLNEVKGSPARVSATPKSESTSSKWATIGLGIVIGIAVAAGICFGLGII